MPASRETGPMHRGPAIYMISDPVPIPYRTVNIMVSKGMLLSVCVAVTIQGAGALNLSSVLPNASKFSFMLTALQPLDLECYSPTIPRLQCHKQ